MISEPLCFYYKITKNNLGLCQNHKQNKITLKKWDQTNNLDLVTTCLLERQYLLFPVMAASKMRFFIKQ